MPVLLADGRLPVGPSGVAAAGPRSAHGAAAAQTLLCGGRATGISATTSPA
ncbi:hypothetical protein ACH4TE_16550 [Streptomyces sioyaensis]|uniref:hypothetical protein n=1 Tax=Streptomyces sioyaensis TaxID=67364 RepID=UPI003787698E